MQEISRRFPLINKKLFVYAGMGLFIVAGMSATHRPIEDPGWKNLKVIPKNIEEDQMERIMYKISHDLSVTCRFCHAETRPGIFPVRVDFASDELREKGIARKMMTMTDRLNKKYFGYKNDYGFGSLKKSVISCNTCHRGLKRPNNKLISLD